MGFFDFITGGEEGQIKRHAKRIKNLNAQAEDRQMSAYWLAEQGSEEAVYGLLGRFSVTYEQRMKDADEKKMVYDLLLGIGEGACEPIRAWVRKNENFALPFQVLDELQGPAAAVDLLLDMLGREVDPFKTEKKRQILIKLADYQDPRIVDRVPALLEDFDEGVRYAAAEALISQETNEVLDDLAKALANPEEESNRLRVRISTTFHQRSWSLGEHMSNIAGRPPVGWVVANGKMQPDT